MLIPVLKLDHVAPPSIVFRTILPDMEKPFDAFKKKGEDMYPMDAPLCIDQLLPPLLDFIKPPVDVEAYRILLSIVQTEVISSLK